MIEKIFIVYAHNRRDGLNGWAAIKADTKKEAKSNARHGWLEEAVVVDVETWEDYTKSKSDKEVKQLIKKIEPDIKKRGWHELEWGR